MRCCLRSTLVAAAACLLMSADAAPTERVLVVSADATLVHKAVASSSTPRGLAERFSPAGLAQLAMDSLGLPTGSLMRLSSDPSTADAQLLVQSPVQADLFSRLDAYAMVFVDSADADVLTTLESAATSGYYKVFDLLPDAAAGPSTKIPSVIASALSGSVGARAQCAGSEVVCAAPTLPAAKAPASRLTSVLKQYTFLDASLSADRALAEELAQTQQLTGAIGGSKKTSPTAFFAVNFGGVAALVGADKQLQARRAIAIEVQALLAALQQAYPHSSGAQVLATSRAATTSVVQQVAAASTPSKVVNSIVAYGRMLLSFNAKIGSGSDDDSDDDDDDDDDDLVAGKNVTKSDITIDDIAEYQIVLWTSVLLGAVLIAVILAMCNMNNRRDSLLYAKFTTSNAGRKFD